MASPLDGRVSSQASSKTLNTPTVHLYLAVLKLVSGFCKCSKLMSFFKLVVHCGEVHVQ